MPGKSKRKGKNKDESKSEKHETEFKSKRIDMVRFAYDVFKHSASKFEVKEHCLSAWGGSGNDYGGPENFIESKGLDSLELVCKLLEDCIKCVKLKAALEKSFLFAEASLSVACELILFLYSEDKDLYLKQLAECWCKCYFLKEKENFEKEHGLEKMLTRGLAHICQQPHDVFDSWIRTYFHDYKKSAQDEYFYNKCLKSSPIHKQKSPEYKYAKTGATFSSKKEKDSRINFKPLLTSKPVEASGIDLTPNPGLGVPLPHEMYDFDLADVAARSQKLPEASREELTKRTKGLTYQERKRNRKPSSRTSEEQSLGQSSLDSSRTKQCSKKTPSVSIATATTQSYEHYGARPKGTVRNRKSSDLHTGESSLCSSVEQDLGQLSFDSSGSKRPGEEKPMPSVSKYLEFPEASGQHLSKHTKGPSYLERERNRASSLRLSVEQGLEQLSLDSSRTKQSS